MKRITILRVETQENNFGLKFKVGQKFTLHKNFGKRGSEETCSISEISPSGLFFKVDKVTDVLFSIKTLQSKGATYTSGYYLISQK